MSPSANRHPWSQNVLNWLLGMLCFRRSQISTRCHVWWSTALKVRFAEPWRK